MENAHMMKCFFFFFAVFIGADLELVEFLAHFSRHNQNFRANSCLLDKISVPFKFFIIIFLIFSKFTAQQTQQVFIKF